MDKKISLLIAYAVLALVPNVPIVFFISIIPSGFGVNSTLGFLLIIFLFCLLTIINPIYLIILSGHYLIQHGINFVLGIILMIISGIGPILVLNKDYWFGTWDFKNDIVFTAELIIAGAILLIGTVVLACLLIKGKSTTN